MTGVLQRPTKITIQQRQIPIMSSPVDLKTFTPVSERRKKFEVRKKFTIEEVKNTQNQHGYFSNWSYTGDNGPENWHKCFPVAASRYQSPINLDLDKVKYDETLEDIRITGYDRDECCSKLKLQNNGCTVKLALKGGVTLSRDDLHHTYEALYICFHWGDNELCGSEHQMDGKSYPMEVQIVHKNTKYNEEEMFEKEDGLLMLAYFVEVGKYRNEAWKNITDVLNKVKYKDEETVITSVALRSFIPNKLTNYFTYVGSLTTPPCNECVTWIVLSDTVKISSQQLNCFRELKTGEDDFSRTMINNFRPPQKLHHRKITTNNIGVYS